MINLENIDNKLKIAKMALSHDIKLVGSFIKRRAGGYLNN